MLDAGSGWKALDLCRFAQWHTMSLFPGECISAPPTTIRGIPKKREWKIADLCRYHAVCCLVHSTCSVQVIIISQSVLQNCHTRISLLLPIPYTTYAAARGQTIQHSSVLHHRSNLRLDPPLMSIGHAEVQLIVVEKRHRPHSSQPPISCRTFCPSPPLRSLPGAWQPEGSGVHGALPFCADLSCC